MSKILKTLLLIFIFVTEVNSQILTESQGNSFINEFLNQSNKLSEIVSPDELKLSKRLGITYQSTKYKFLISNNIESSIISKLLNKSVGYNFKIDSLNKNYSVLKFLIPSLNIERDYYFYKSYLISKPYYFSRNWAIEKSKYFEFHISAPELFNEYSMRKLDAFVDKMLKVLNINEDEINILKKEKIHYFLCKNEDEIELLIGYKARGLYYLPYDYIISTFNCHYHEIMHLLMNYKLQQVPLYTLPLLQEGFAVAYGGRGGKEPDIILNMGLFIAQNHFLNIQSLLSKSEFEQFDASLTYPISGMYVKFLIQNRGIKWFINLYKKYSGDAEIINRVKIDTTDLPSNKEWENYLKEKKNNNSISISEVDVKDFTKEIKKSENYKIYENSANYLFELKGSIILTPKNYLMNYESKLFQELYTNKKYQGEKYLIIPDTNEISVYNLFSNNLIAKYVRSFTTENKPVFIGDGFYLFSIKKKIFDESIKNLKISGLGM